MSLSPSAPLALEMSGITKGFPGVVANQDVELRVRAGSLHAIVGENGAGKSTLMNMLYGRYTPDHGTISLVGRRVEIPSPAAAIRLGVGLVTQHTTLIPALSLLENIILGAEPSRTGTMDRAAARQKITDLCRLLDVHLDPSEQASDVSVATLQKAEIVKALYRGARILVLDEPTAMLAPQEADSLFRLLHDLTAGGATVIFITHRLREVMAHSEEVTVLRGGRSVARRETKQTNPDELVRLMMGASADQTATYHESRAPARGEPPVLELDAVRIAGRGKRAALHDVCLTVAPGEIVGMAGVDGSGQRELAEAILGLRAVADGRVVLCGQDVTTLSTARRMAMGMAFVPEDRGREGAIGSFTVAENLILGRQRRKSAGGGALLNLRTIEENAARIIDRSKVRALGPRALFSTLSGGNQQKVIIGRALTDDPRLLVAMQPTRGLDVDAASGVYEQIRTHAQRGMAALVFSLDLDELMEIADRIAVLHAGELVGVIPRQEATLERVGHMMVEGGH